MPVSLLYMCRLGDERERGYPTNNCTSSILQMKLHKKIVNDQSLDLCLWYKQIVIFHMYNFLSNPQPKRKRMMKRERLAAPAVLRKLRRVKATQNHRVGNKPDWSVKVVLTPLGQVRENVDGPQTVDLVVVLVVRQVSYSYKMLVRLRVGLCYGDFVLISNLVLF